jgi:hypothetical protein
VEFIDELAESLLLLEGALQLQQHMLHRQVVRHRATVVGGICTGVYVPLQRNKLGFVDSFRDALKEPVCGIRSFGRRQCCREVTLP